MAPPRIALTADSMINAWNRTIAKHRPSQAGLIEELSISYNVFKREEARLVADGWVPPWQEAAMVAAADGLKTSNIHEADLLADAIENLYKVAFNKQYPNGVLLSIAVERDGIVSFTYEKTTTTTMSSRISLQTIGE